DPRDFLDQVRGALDVTPPAWNGYFGAAHLKPKALEYFPLALLGNIYPSQSLRPAIVELDGPPFDRRLSRANRCRRVAAAHVEDEAGEDREAVVQKSWINATLEPGAGIAGEAERLAGAGNPLGREISDLEHDVGRRFAYTRILAAHDAANVMDLRIVGDDGHE